MSASTIITVVLIGGLIIGLIYFLPQIMAKFGSPSPQTLTQWFPAWLSPTGTNYGSGSGPGPATPPSQAGIISKTHTSPPSSTGGGVGGPGRVAGNAPPSNTILTYGPKKASPTTVCGPGNRNATKCADLRNSPGTYNACCASYTRAFAGYHVTGRPRKVKHIRSFNNMPYIPTVPSYRVRYRARRVRRLPTVYQ